MNNEEIIPLNINQAIELIKKEVNLIIEKRYDTKLAELTGEDYRKAIHSIIEEVSNKTEFVLLGPPGIGKSQRLLKIQDEIRKKLAHKIITDPNFRKTFIKVKNLESKAGNINLEDLFFIAQLVPTNIMKEDLTGLMVVNFDELTKYLVTDESVGVLELKSISARPKFLDADIIFIDEITNATQNEIAPIAQLLSERMIGGHKLNDFTYIVAAGNRKEDSVLVKTNLPQIFKTRFVPLEVSVNPLEVVEYLSKTYNPYIVNFNMANPSIQNALSNIKYDTPNEAYVTARSLEKLILILIDYLIVLKIKYPIDFEKILDKEIKEEDKKSSINEFLKKYEENVFVKGYKSIIEKEILNLSSIDLRKLFFVLAHNSIGYSDKATNIMKSYSNLFYLDTNNNYEELLFGKSKIKYDKQAISINHLFEVIKLQLLKSNTKKRVEFLMLGSPGIGKSTLSINLKEFVEKNRLLEKPDISVVVPSQRTKEDWSGYQMINFDDMVKEIKKYKTEYKTNKNVKYNYRVISKATKPEYLNSGIIFIDEITNSTPRQLAPVSQLISERQIGEHRLREETYIISAGNTIESSEYARELPSIITTRLVIVNVVSDLNKFIEYAKNSNFHQTITEFLVKNKDNPNFSIELKDMSEEEDKIRGYISPRSLKKLSDFFKKYEKEHLQLLKEKKDIENYLKTLIYGFIGEKYCKEIYDIYYAHLNIKLQEKSKDIDTALFTLHKYIFNKVKNRGERLIIPQIKELFNDESIKEALITVLGFEKQNKINLEEGEKTYNNLKTIFNDVTKLIEQTVEVKYKRLPDEFKNEAVNYILRTIKNNDSGLKEEIIKLRNENPIVFYESLLILFNILSDKNIMEQHDILNDVLNKLNIMYEKYINKFKEESLENNILEYQIDGVSVREHILNSQGELSKDIVDSEKLFFEIYPTLLLFDIFDNNKIEEVYDKIDDVRKSQLEGIDLRKSTDAIILLFNKKPTTLPSFNEYKIVNEDGELNDITNEVERDIEEIENKEIENLKRNKKYNQLKDGIKLMIKYHYEKALEGNDLSNYTGNNLLNFILSTIIVRQALLIGETYKFDTPFPINDNVVKRVPLNHNIAIISDKLWNEVYNQVNLDLINKEKVVFDENLLIGDTKEDKLYNMRYRRIRTYNLNFFVENIFYIEESK